MTAYINTGAYFRVLWDEIRYNLENMLKEYGFEDVSHSQGWIFYITEETSSRITDLAAKAGITKQSMSGLAAQLKKGGHVKKHLI